MGAITTRRYGQSDIPAGAERADIHDALDHALTLAVVRDPGSKPVTVLWDQVEISTEVLREAERTFHGSTLLDERNILTVMVPVVFDV